MDNITECLVDLTKAKTFSEKRETAEKIVEQHDAEHLKQFIEEDWGFIATKKTKQISEEIAFEKFSRKNSPYVILSGSYGSGKSALINELYQIAEEGKEYPNRNMVMDYGVYDIRPIQITMVESNTLKKFLTTILERLKDIKTEEWVVGNYQNIRVSELDKPEEEFNEVEDISDVIHELKALHTNSIVEVLIQLSKEFKKSSVNSEGNQEILGFFIDEVEQAARFTEGGKLNEVIRTYLRQVTETKHFDDSDPASVTIFSIADLKVLKEYGDWRDDILDRLENQVINLDMSPEEARELMQEILRNYFTVLCKDFMSKDEKAENWLEKLEENSNQEDENYSYPISKEVHEYIVYEILEQKKGAELVQDFRSYKTIIAVLIDLSEDFGEHLIDFDEFVRNGSAIKRELGEHYERRLEGIKDNGIPDEGAIEDLIIEAFDLDGSQADLMNYILKYLLSSKRKDTVYLKKSEIIDNVDFEERRVEQEDIDQLFNTISQLEDEFTEINENTLTFHKSEFLGKLRKDDTGKTTRRRYQDLVNEEIPELNKTTKEATLLETLKAYYEETKDWSTKLEEDRLIVSKTGENYIGKYIISTDGRSRSSIRNIVDSDAALNIGLIINESEAEEYPHIDFDVILPGFFTDEKSEEIADELRKTIDKDVLRAITEGIHDSIHIPKSESNITALKIAMFNTISDLSEYSGDPLPPGYLDIDLIYDLDVSGKEKWVNSKLGFKNDFKGKEVYDMIYAVQNKISKNKKSVFFDKPNLWTEVDEEVPRISKISPAKDDPEEFRNYYNRKWSDEIFFDHNGEVTNSKIWKSSNNSIEELENLLRENEEIGFSEIEKTIFGTSEIGSVAKAKTYLILILGEAQDLWKIERSGSLPKTKIKKMEEAASREKERLESRIKNAVEKALLKEIKDGESNLEDLLEEYSVLIEIDASNSGSLENIKNIEERIDELEPADEEGTVLKKGIVDDKSLNQEYEEVGPYLKKLREISKKSTSYLAILIDSEIETLNENLRREQRFYGNKNDLESLNQIVSSIDNSFSGEAIPDSNLSLLPRLSEFVNKNNLSNPQELVEEFNDILENEAKSALESGEFSKDTIESFRSKLIPSDLESGLESDFEDVFEEKISNVQDQISELVEEEIEKAQTQVEEAKRMKEKEIYSHQKQEITSEIRSISSIVQALRSNKNRPLKADIAKHINDLEDELDQLNEIREEAIKGSQELVKEWKSEKKADIEFEKVKEGAGLSLEDILEDIEPESLYQLYEDSKGNNKEIIGKLIARKCAYDLEGEN